MSDQRILRETRSEVVSVRFTPDEVSAIRAHCGDGEVSRHIRNAALAAATGVFPAAPSVRTWHGEAWVLLAQGARVISIRRAPGYTSSGVGISEPADARRLAAALLEAADVQEQRNLSDEAWDAEHADGAA